MFFPAVCALSNALVTGLADNNYLNALCNNIGPFAFQLICENRLNVVVQQVARLVS